MTKKELHKLEPEARGLKIITKCPDNPGTAVIEYTGIRFNADEDRFEVVRTPHEHGVPSESAEPLSDKDIARITMNSYNWLILDFTK